MSHGMFTASTSSMTPESNTAVAEPTTRVSVLPTTESDTTVTRGEVALPRRGAPNRDELRRAHSDAIRRALQGDLETFLTSNRQEGGE